MAHTGRPPTHLTWLYQLLLSDGIKSEGCTFSARASFSTVEDQSAFSIHEGPNPPDTFSILISASELVFVDKNTLTGFGAFGGVPCTTGPLTCPDPTELVYPMPQFPIILTRLTFD